MFHETHTCDICGREDSSGMTDDHREFWVCEWCFENYMDDTYGAGNWKRVDDDGCDGFYMVKENGKWYGTGIYCTTWDWED